MRLVLDAGALIAVVKADRDTVALGNQELLHGRAPLTHGGVSGQTWRGETGRQVHLARLLPALDIASIDETLGRSAGILLRRSRMNDVIDAALVLLAEDGDLLLTSDPDDLEPLAAAARLHVDIVPV
jgi:hypothetical protein